MARQRSDTGYPEDFETRATVDDHDDLRLWLRMMTVNKMVNNEVRRRLRTAFNMSLPRFDLMAQLDRNPDGIRMGELSKRLMVTTGNITGLTDELEREGLVERTADPEHRRAFLVRFTPKGRALFQTVAKENAAWIVEMFSGLPARDKTLMFDILARQKAWLSAALFGAPDRPPAPTSRTGKVVRLPRERV